MKTPIDGQSAEGQTWDTLIVGTGMGGATLGHALAKAGQKVLFCERGRYRRPDTQDYAGQFAELFISASSSMAAPSREEILSLAGRCTEQVEDHSQGRKKPFVPYIGYGAGGSSALYGMALERFNPSDFHPRSNYPNAHHADLPEHWPINYEDLLPHYEAAEKLYRVRGSADPLRSDSNQSLLSPPKMTSANQALFEHFQNQGLNPYRLPLACEFIEGCTGCQGHLCGRQCKNDSASVCLSPAVDNYDADIIDQCEVLHLDASSDKVASLECDWQGNRIRLSAERVVLAAGALQTPLLLLKSTSGQWPTGLGNKSGLVGKYLMRHCIDLYAVKTEQEIPSGQNIKELAFNDFYLEKGTKLGTVQSFGPMPPPPAIIEELVEGVKADFGSFAGSSFQLLRPLLSKVIDRMFSSRMVFATIMEDMPLKQNQVRIGAGKTSLELCYSLNAEEKKRVSVFREKMHQALSPYRYKLLKQSEDNQRIAHACGTCRFGDDAELSVLNRNNRVHGVSNLYIVDAAFLPSSGGTNPSLTIAANALRVAQCILSEDG